jgi:hypothetical protein
MVDAVLPRALVNVPSSSCLGSLLVRLLFSALCPDAVVRIFGFAASVMPSPKFQPRAYA